WSSCSARSTSQELERGGTWARTVTEGAHVATGAQLADDVSVAPGAVIHDGVSVGAGCVIGSGAVIHAGSSIGAGCVIEDGAILGKRPRLRRGSSAAGGAA